MPSALDAARALLADPQGAGDAPVDRGYLDLTGPREPPAGGLAQRLMRTRAVPLVYERWWRPALGRVAKGPLGPGMGAEARLARRGLGLASGDRVLDVACGPGNFTRALAADVEGDGGLVVGIDASPAMLVRAVADTHEDDVAYVRGDAVELPFADGAFDAVCCFAALHLFAEPWQALDHMARVLRPGGRIALLTSCRRGLGAAGAVEALAVQLASGMRVFGQREVIAGLRERGFGELTQRVAGFTQFVCAARVA